MTDFLAYKTASKKIKIETDTAILIFKISIERKEKYTAVVMIY